MIKKMDVASLKPGMYVVDPGLEADKPHIYGKNVLIADDAQIKEIQALGYLQAFVDSDKGTYFQDIPEEKRKIEALYRRAAASAVAPPPEPAPRRRTAAALAANLDQAEDIYVNALDYVRDFLTQFSKDRHIDMRGSESLVDGVLIQIQANVDSLLFVSKLKVHDKYTFTHNLNVAVIAAAFGESLGLGQEKAKILGLCGLFHDIGKVDVPLEILCKPDKLTPREFEEMKLHPIHGHAILSRQDAVKSDVLRSALEHHEHYVGGGYPHGKRFAEIAMASAIVSLADVFDALTSERPYKGAMHLHKALGIIFNLRGASFHPTLTDRFVKFLGIYPVGSIVVLANGSKGVVIEQNPENLLRPWVRLALDANNARLAPVDVDLSSAEALAQAELAIVECVGPETCRINVSEYLRAA